jgi:hypothetical protein
MDFARHMLETALFGRVACLLGHVSHDTTIMLDTPASQPTPAFQPKTKNAITPEI